MFQPSSVLDHKVTKVLVKMVEVHTEPTIKMNKQRQVRVKVLWKNGEISWINAHALRHQNLYLLVAYAEDSNLSQHSDFTWTQDYKEYDFDHHSRVLATKHHQGPVIKVSIQVPKNAAHARKLDELSNNNLWYDTNKKELKSLKI